MGEDSRRDQLQAAVQCMRQPLQRRLGRVPGAPLDTTDIRLRDTGQPGKLSLRQALPDPGIPELQPKNDTRGEHRRRLQGPYASSRRRSDFR